MGKANKAGNTKVYETKYSNAKKSPSIGKGKSTRKSLGS